MTIDQLQQALFQDGYLISADFGDRLGEAFAALASHEVPNLGFLPPRLQVAVLAALYRDFIAQVMVRAPQPVL